MGLALWLTLRFTDRFLPGREGGFKGSALHVPAQIRGSQNHVILFDRLAVLKKRTLDIRISAKRTSPCAVCCFCKKRESREWNPDAGTHTKTLRLGRTAAPEVQRIEPCRKW